MATSLYGAFDSHIDPDHHTGSTIVNSFATEPKATEFDCAVEFTDFGRYSLTIGRIDETVERSAFIIADIIDHISTFKTTLLKISVDLSM